MKFKFWLPLPMYRCIYQTVFTWGTLQQALAFHFLLKPVTVLHWFTWGTLQQVLAFHILLKPVTVLHRNFHTNTPIDSILYHVTWPATMMKVCQYFRITMSGHLDEITMCMSLNPQWMKDHSPNKVTKSAWLNPQWMKGHFVWTKRV